MKDYSRPNKPANQHQCRKRAEELAGQVLYGTQSGTMSQRRIRKLKARRAYLLRLLPSLGRETNKIGSEMYRGGEALALLISRAPGIHIPATLDRYVFDFGLCSRAAGWQQWDTWRDAYYFGIWVHAQDRLVTTYCEGDITVTKSPDADVFREQIADMEGFYGASPPAGVVFPRQLDAMTRTRWYNPRLSCTEI